jgi:hypothetical protein
VLVGNTGRVNTVILNKTSGSFNVTTQTNYTFQSYYIINQTKTTSEGLLQKNDLYNTIGVIIDCCYIYDPYGDFWLISCEVIDLSSSRKNGSADSTSTIRSQMVKVVGASYDDIKKISFSGWEQGAWPKEGTDNWNGILTLNRFNQNETDKFMLITVNATADSTPFPLNASTLSGKLRYHSGTYSITGPELMKAAKEEMDSKTKVWSWSYSQWPWDNKPDSVAVIGFHNSVSPGGKLEFDVVADTSSLSDDSESVVHINITTPYTHDSRNISEVTVEMS